MAIELKKTHKRTAGPAGSAMIVRPAELVELSERVYRGIFGAGLYVAALTALYAVGLAFVQVTALHRGLAAGICVGLTIALLVAARHDATVYGALHRRPAIWMPMLGMGLGLAHVAIGPASQVLFPPTLTLVGVLGAAVPKRWVLVAAALVAAGQASPVLTHALSANEQRAVLTAACADVFIPVLFGVLIGYLAHYMLDLHRTIAIHANTPPGRPQRINAGMANVSVVASPGAPATPERVTAPKRATPGSLTPRQLQVVALAAEGLRHAEIGACLGIGVGQVTRLLAQARRRLGVATNQELVAWAIRTGVFPPTA